MTIAYRCTALLVLALIIGSLPADDGLPAAAATPDAPDSFDCADAFDVVALLVVYRCAAYRPPAAAAASIAAAMQRLHAYGFVDAADAAQTRIAFCPLATGTGMVPAPGLIYLDDGLMTMSSDGLAEIIAHELEHVRQFRALGTRGFKCDYVRQMAACGGCQDRRHPLEQAAYLHQDEVRTLLLREAGIRP